jgi:hypothetical protein
MTKRIGNRLFIYEQKPAKCEMCGQIDELRPYGPKGENVCFDCAMKDEAVAAERFKARLGGLSEVKRRH